MLPNATLCTSLVPSTSDIMPRPRAVPPAMPPSDPPARPSPERAPASPGALSFAAPSPAAAASPEPPHAAKTPMIPAHASPRLMERTTSGFLLAGGGSEAHRRRWDLAPVRAREFCGRQVVVDGRARSVNARGEQGKLGVVHFELSAQASLKSKRRDPIRLIGFGGVLVQHVVHGVGAGELRLRPRH